MKFYALDPEVKRLIILLVVIHNVFNSVAHPFSDPLGKGLRAAGDIGFSTFVSLFTTLGVRLVFSLILGIGLGMGVVGIALAMCLDWIIRGFIFWRRFQKGAWKRFRVI